MDLILVYHRIADDGWRYSVSPDHFREQIEVLQSCADTLPLARIVQDRSRSGATPRVAITFDDGYRDNVTHAWPLLRRHDVPATFFIVSGHVGSSREFWWDELEWLLFHAASRNSVVEVQIGDEWRVWDLGMPEEQHDPDRTRNVRWPESPAEDETPRDRAHRELHDLLRARDAEDQLRMLENIAASMDVRVQARAGKLPVTHEQFQRLMGEELAEIGAHTVEHLSLRDLPVAAQEREIRRSKRNLEAMAGRPVSSFAYPYGLYAHETLGLVEQAGFQLACTVGERPVGQENRFRIPRMTPQDWDGEMFAEQFQRALSHRW